MRKRRILGLKRFNNGRRDFAILCEKKEYWDERDLITCGGFLRYCDCEVEIIGQRDFAILCEKKEYWDKRDLITCGGFLRYCA